jgi:tetratricopeptide (TPR) repeat protein
MRSYLISVMLMALCPIGESSHADTPKSVAFTHVNVVDLASGSVRSNQTVIITANRIATVEDADKVPAAKDVQVVDASGKFLIPGLWDMHVHWYDKDYLPLFLVNGVTGIRMMWGMPLHYEFRKRITAGEWPGPRMVIASALIDGPVYYWPDSTSVHTPEEARKAVEREKQAGADFIKEYSFLPRDLYFAIADESKKLGIPFAGHVPWGVSSEEASNAGQKSMEHLFGILNSCSSREQELLQAAQADLADMIASGKASFDSTRLHQMRDMALDTYDAGRASQLFARFRKNGTWQCPTLIVNRSFAYRNDPSYRDDSRLKYLPRSVRASWTPESHRGIAGDKPEDFAYSKRLFQKDLELVAAMNRAGVGIIAGTDVLNPFCFPGFSLPDEIELYVKAGLSPLEALRTATSNPARFLGREKDMGSVEAGKLADLVLLDANPLTDINNVRKISAVVADGRFYSRENLDAMLAKIAALASRKSIAEAVSKTISGDGLDAAVKQYHELKSTQSGSYDFSEGELNTLGYELIAAKKFKEAILIFQLNVEAYPQSSNVYDSLAEAFMNDGDKQLAIENYQKSLELDPGNRNAAQMLEKLRPH